MKGFIDFIRERGIVGLAIGVTLAGAVGKLVSALVADLINPLIGLLMGKAGNLKAGVWHIGSASIMWGDFVSAVIDFVIIAAVLYFGVKALRLEKLDKKTH